jgi:hypothetical protein
MPGRGELQNEFSWSKSRDGIFSSCLRAYYYRYYGSWNGWRHDAPADVRELYVMKNLQSFPMWKGSVVHRVVKQAVSGLREGKPLSVDRALVSVRDRMMRDFEDSRTGRYRQRPNRICGLLEHYYDTAIPDQALHEAVVFAEGCIKRLYTTGSYRKMLQLGPSSIVEFESLQSITLSGCKVWVSPDVIIRDMDDKIVIVDWKTGGSSLSNQTRLQLAIYGLYVAQRYGMPSGLLVGVEENLRSGREHVYPLKEWILEDARRYMEDSIQKMQSLLHDRERNVALFRDFPMTDKLALCMGCSFRRACFRSGNT